jgi:hypothetical protein
MPASLPLDPHSLYEHGMGGLTCFYSGLLFAAFLER